MPSRWVFAVVITATGFSLSVSLNGTVAAQETKSTWDGIYSEPQATRGESLYSDSCGFCHGRDLRGTDSAPAITGRAFAYRWNERSLGELFEYVQVAMPLTSPGGFSREQNADIVAFMLRQGDFPAGQSDLPHQRDELSQFTFLAMKR